MRSHCSSHTDILPRLLLLFPSLPTAHLQPSSEDSPWLSAPLHLDTILGEFMCLRVTHSNGRLIHSRRLGIPSISVSSQKINPPFIVPCTCKAQLLIPEIKPFPSQHPDSPHTCLSFHSLSSWLPWMSNAPG